MALRLVPHPYIIHTRAREDQCTRKFFLSLEGSVRRGSHLLIARMPQLRQSFNCSSHSIERVYT